MAPWKVTLTDTTLSDLDAILETTLQEFGTMQLRRYIGQIEKAIKELEDAGNRAPPLRHRPDIRPEIFVFPLAREGRASPHHFYLKIDNTRYRRVIIILRILHQRMDPEYHL